MKDAYPDVHKKISEISTLVEKTEEAFIRVRGQRIPELKQKIRELRGSGQSIEINPFLRGLGDLFFIYRDTYGLPLSTIISVAKDTLPVDEHKKIESALPIYHEKMNDQQERSRASSKMTGDRFADIELNLAGTHKTKFTGYEHLDGKGKILKLFVNDSEVNQTSAGDHVKVILDHTPFYAEAGGQIGDTGYLTGKHGKIRVLDTKKQDDIYLHFGKVEEGELKVNETVEAKIDTERRLSIMRNHTATHLLQSALREILGTHVQQQGSLVAEDRLRFDFTHPKAVTKDELSKIESKINEHISRRDTVVKEEMSLEEAKKKGALAFFAEKYGKTVRVISIGSYSKEFCGGTHLNSTGEIQKFIISGEGAVAQGIRRLEARTGSGAEEFIKERAKKQSEQKESEEKRQQELKEKKEADKRRLESFRNNLKALIDKAESVNSTKIVAQTFTDSDANQLKDFSDLIKQQIQSFAICFGSTSNGSASVVVGVSSDLVQKGIKANELIKDIAPLINGTGGGRPELAQAGSKEPEKLVPAIKQAVNIIKGKLK